MPGTFYRRQLPHLQRDSKPHFLTFCTHHHWILPEQTRSIVLDSCIHEHDKSVDLLCIVVMPDHVHLIFTPLIDEQRREVFSLAHVMNAIKGLRHTRSTKLYTGAERCGSPNPSTTSYARQKVSMRRFYTCLRIRCVDVWRTAGRNTPGRGRRAQGISTLPSDFASRGIFPNQKQPLNSCPETAVLGIKTETPGCQGSRPNTPTLLIVPTYTLPFAMVGVMNLLPVPNWSRPPLAWLLL